MTTLGTHSDLVELIASEIAAGIDDAVGYWLGRVERQLADSGLTSEEQLLAIELILTEYKEATGKMQFRCAQA